MLPTTITEIVPTYNAVPDAANPVTILEAAGDAQDVVDIAMMPGIVPFDRKSRPIKGGF